MTLLLQVGHVPLNLIGDGLLPAVIDGKRLPRRNSPAPIVGTQDDASYGATFDALNIWEFDVDAPPRSPRSHSRNNCRSRCSTRSTRAHPRPATACRSRASRQSESPFSRSLASSCVSRTWPIVGNSLLPRLNPNRRIRP